MTITSRDQLIDAMGNSSSRFILDKASIASQAAGSYVSMWRATVQPGQGAVPTTADGTYSFVGLNRNDLESYTVLAQDPNAAAPFLRTAAHDHISAG